MDLKVQRRMAAAILKCGENRVWIDPLNVEDVEMSITRGDIRSNINAGAIRAKPKRGISRARARHQKSQKKKGRQKGHGSRKGGKKARTPKKERWMKLIRPIRRYLREQRDEGKIEVRTYRMFYTKAKGGMFKSVNHLEAHLISGGYFKEEGKGGG